MSTINTRHVPLLPNLWTALRTRWTEHRQRRAAWASLDRLLAKSDDRLLDDIGIDRVTAHRLLGETMVVPHRAWDRWQL